MALDKIVTILDIGSSKIVCLIANISNGKIKILGSGCNSANGFRNGNINDARSATTSIIAAIEQAENAANITIDKVVLALNGYKIKSHYLQPEISLKKQKVTEQDISNLVLQGVKQLEEKAFEVIHCFPLEYILDGNKDIKDPNGLIGKKLSANIHFVTVPNILLENLVSCLGKCQLNVEDCVFSPYAAGLSILNDNEKENGATIIDFGSGISSYALFYKKNMVNAGFVPIGSSAISNDIAKSFMLDPATAERIKTIHGAASVHYADSQKMINYKVETSMFGQFDTEDRSISNAELNDVINARVEEIFNLLKFRLSEQSKYSNSNSSVILTGGGSMLTGVSEQAEAIFATKVRLGKLADIESINQDLMNETYASALAVIQYLANNQQLKSSLEPSSFVKKMLSWLKENF